MEAEGIESNYTRISMLGRNDIQLGDLYNYRNDRVVKGNQLEGKCWPNRKEVEYLLELKHSKSYNKLDHMNLDEHSQASVVGNLIEEYCGASLYLNERWKVTEATGTLICRIQTGKRFLDMATLMKNEAPYFPTDEKEVKKFIKSSEATHVVVGLVYGYESYCVIAKDLDDDEEETRKEEEERLSEFASQFVDGLKDCLDPNDFKQQFDKYEINHVNQIKCRLYADNQNRCVRKYGVFDVYQLWSKLAEKTDEFTIAAIVCPIRIIVDPLSSFPDELFDYYYDTESKLIVQFYFHLFEVRRIIFRMNANLFDSKKTNRQSLRQFRMMVRKYQELIKKSMKHAILEARRTIEDDDEIVRIIDICDTHPVFRPSQLKRWLSEKQVEWEMIEKMANLSGITFLPSKKILKKALADNFDKKFSLVLNIPPLDEKTNERLEAMRDYVETSAKLVAVVDEEQMRAYYNIPCWYMVEQKRKLVADEIRRMADHARRNQDDKSQVQFFIIPGDYGQDFRWHYSVYESENLLNDKLSQLPGPPTNVHYQVVSTGNNNNNICYSTSISGLLKWDYQDLGIPCHFIVQYRLKDSFWTDCWMQKTTKSGESQMAINLFYDKSRVVEFRVAADTYIGLGEFSEIFESHNSSDVHYPGNSSETAEEMKPKVSDDEPLAITNNDTIPNGHGSVSLLSILGLFQPSSELLRQSDEVLQPTTQATAKEINQSVGKDKETGEKSENEEEVSALQFKSRNYVNIIEEYYDPDEDSDNGFEHYTI